MQLEKKVNLPVGRGVQVGVEIQDPQIEPGGLYALDLDLRLAYWDDLRVTPHLDLHDEGW